MIKVNRIVEDAEFGHIYIKTNVRAVRYTFKPAKDGSKEGGLLVTVPEHYRLEHVLATVEEHRPQLREMMNLMQQQKEKQIRNRKIDWDFRINSDCLYISIVKGTREGFYLHHEPGEFRAEGADEVVVKAAEMQLICPPDVDFEKPGLQEWLEKALIEGVRKHAKNQLIPRMLRYAQHYGIGLHEVKVNNSKGHWGSCASHRQGTLLNRKQYFNINLSLFTLLLPMPLQRLILLHELTHTRHMDHSAAFHRDLDQWLGGKEEALEQELKRFTTNIYSFVDDQNPAQN